MYIDWSVIYLYGINFIFGVGIITFISDVISEMYMGYEINLLRANDNQSHSFRL